jgi:hypothetical protein
LGARRGFGQGEDGEVLAVGREVQVGGAGVEERLVVPDARLAGSKESPFTV